MGLISVSLTRARTIVIEPSGRVPTLSNERLQVGVRHAAEVALRWHHHTATN